jgi:hypothetical protein
MSQGAIASAEPSFAKIDNDCHSERSEESPSLFFPEARTTGDSSLRSE